MLLFLQGIAYLMYCVLIFTYWQFVVLYCICFLFIYLFFFLLRAGVQFVTYNLHEGVILHERSNHVFLFRTAF